MVGLKTGQVGLPILQGEIEMKEDTYSFTVCGPHLAQRDAHSSDSGREAGRLEQK